MKEELKDIEPELTSSIIGCAIEVHRELGPGLLEACYESCLTYELIDQGHDVRRQVPARVAYKGRDVECGFRIDLLVDDRAIVEVKSVDKLHPVHSAQLLTYLRLTHVRVSLLMNFNEKRLTDGLKRLVI